MGEGTFMDPRRFGGVVGALTAVIVFCAASAAAQLVPIVRAPQVSLGIASGAPEAPTEVALRLATPGDVPVGRVDATVTFPVTLEFSKVGGVLVSEKIVRVETTMATTADGHRTLTLSLQPADGDQPLLSEVNVTLVFNVVKDARPGVLDVTLQAKAFAPDGKPVEGLKVFDGRVNIQESDTFYACFFYMH